jgi:hypothetical protein
VTWLREVIVVIVTEFSVDGFTARTFQDWLALAVVVVLVWSKSPITASTAAEESGSAASDGMYFLHLWIEEGMKGR